MPLRVSGVPPLLEVTTQSVSPSRPGQASSMRAMPSGSVLSKKWTRIRSRGRIAQGVGHELRAQRGAADADRQQVRESCRGRRPDLAAVHPAANVLTSATVLRISAAISGVGASSGARSQ